MWIFFPNAMLSFVAHRDQPDALMVRARFAGDIERIFPTAKVTRTPRADYLYRSTLSRALVGQVLAAHAAGMGYTNVKGAIPAGDHRRSHAMHDTWQVMFDAQHAAEPFARMDAREPVERGPVRLHSDSYYAHTTARGEPRTVHVQSVQDRVEDEPLVSLLFQESGYATSLPLSTAQRWLRNADLLP